MGVEVKAVTRMDVGVMSPENLTALTRRQPNPAFKRTHTGGADLLVHQALRAPVRAA